MNTEDPVTPGQAPSSEPKHWLLIAGTSLCLGTLVYAGMLFPFAVTDGLLGLNCHGWVKGPRGAASLLFILGWGCAVAVMAGRVYGRTETLGDLVQWKDRLLPGGPGSSGANEAPRQGEEGTGNGGQGEP